MAVVRTSRLRTTLDHTSEIVLKPVIRELVRTEVYPPALTFLVDKIYILSFIDPDDQERREAYRIWLSDGENAIQAILKHEIHPFVTTGEIREGSYVSVTKYRLARRERLNGDGVVVHLEIANFHAIGHDKRRAQSPTFQDIEAIRKDASKVPSEKIHATPKPKEPIKSPQDEKDSEQDDLALQHLESSGDAVDLIRWSDSPAKEKAQADAIEDSANLASNAKKRKCDEDLKPLQSRNPNPSTKTAKISRSSSMQTARDRNETVTTRIHKSQGPPKESPKQLLPISRPVLVTPLADLTGSKATRNEIHDVFAVVCSVDPSIISRTGIQDTRHIRVMDPSTTKKVLLSVFVDPHRFKPAVGTVALIRSVLTHTWDGGSLNIYAKQCKGRQWFVQDPVGVEGCDTEALKAWWARRGSEEQDPL